jgi:hypothetical protein
VPIEVEPFPPAPGGMNTAIPAWELDDTEAQYIQDGLADKPGLLRRRGPIQEVPTISQPTLPITNFMLTLDPKGTNRYAALTGDATHGYVEVWSDDKLSRVQLTWPHVLPASPQTSLALAYRNSQSRASLMGGSWVGVSDRIDSNGPLQGLALWRGGNKANYTTGTLTVARGSASVTGAGTSWLSNAAPGMFLFANTDDAETSVLIGVVKVVNSDTSITLEKVSGYPCTAKAYTLQSLRGFAPKVGEGLVTCATTATAINGGNTKFVSQGLSSGTWRLYRRSDFVFIGKVASVASETQLTLAANAALNLADEPYIALKSDADFAIETTASTQKVGWLTSTYAGRQWFANNGAQFDKTYRLWYSDTDDPELVDLSEDGTWIPVSSTGDIQEPIKALGSAYNAMVVLKDTEAFAVYGSSPATFSVKKLWDDGVLSTGSVQLYGGGVLWAGQSGVHFYDGVQVSNLLLDKLGDVWRNSIASFDSTRYRMWSTIIRDHYWLHIEKIAPTIAVVKGNVSSTPDRWTVAINMVTRAVTMNTNLNFRGAIRLPSTGGDQVWYAANDSTKGHICVGDAIFDDEGLDAFACDGGTVGPDFYFESKKFNQGDPLRLKRFKQLAIYYLVQGGSIKLDTIIGLNEIGTTATSEFPASVYTWSSLSNTITTWTGLKQAFSTWSQIVQAVYVPKRIRFLKRNQHFSFRLYQSSSSIVRLRIGPFEIGWKWMRAGRV